MDAPRFRRGRSWIESLGEDLALAILLSALLVLEERMSEWFAQHRALDQIGRDFLLFFRSHLAWTLPTVTLMSIGRLALPARGWRRWAGLAVTVTVASIVGYGAMQHWSALICDCVSPDGRYQEWALRHQVFVIAVTIAGIREFMHLARRADGALHDAQLRELEAAGLLAAERLQLLQAQIEPHFLFNSLANLRHLLRTDRPAGQGMLTDLLHYLEIALPRMRSADFTLSREIELVHAYLSIHQVRMGPRLQFQIAIPEGLSEVRIPPMSLLTLVENALKHGLNPLPEGGTICVSANVEHDSVLVEVADTGRGLTPGSGSGVGLGNLRGRLRAIYGSSASLTLRLNEPHGVVATVALPCHAGPTDRDG